MRAELAAAPVEVVVANHCYGLFELAAVYLSQQPPLLDQARLAIDALGCLVDGLEGRLGEGEGALKEGLTNLRLAYVQIDGAQRAGADVDAVVGVAPDRRRMAIPATTPAGERDAGTPRPGSPDLPAPATVPGASTPPGSAASSACRSAWSARGPTWPCPGCSSPCSSSSGPRGRWPSPSP